MALQTDKLESLLDKGFSRRQLGRIASLLTAGSAMPLFSEHALAQQAEQATAGRLGARAVRMTGPNVVRISSNENPWGPCKEGLEAIMKVAPHGGYYDSEEVGQDFQRTIAETEGVKPNYISMHAGSSDLLHRFQCAYTSPTRSWTMANPGYGAGAPAFVGSKLVSVPLRADYSHDVEGMIKADPNAGAYYVVNPNNPTGTLTARKDIEYLLANKAKDAIVIVDEAYIHFSEAHTVADMVAADKDVVVLHTFSKIFGMAGIRAGYGLGRPDILAKLRQFGVGFNPVTGTACGAASLKVAKTLVPERKALMTGIRESVFNHFDQKNYKYIRSQTNFFMVETNRSGRDVADAMAEQGVLIGRIWPVWPTKVRVSIGTQEQMNKFMTAFDKVMSA